MTDPSLFREDQIPAWPDWFTPGKTTPATHVQNVRRGLHPLGLPLLKTHDGATCGNCRHLCRVSQSGTYIKCELYIDRLPSLQDITMTFDQIWDQLTHKDPRLNQDEAEVVFQAKNLRRLLRQVHEQGVKQGYKAASPTSFGEELNRMFGRVRK